VNGLIAEFSVYRKWVISCDVTNLNHE